MDDALVNFNHRKTPETQLVNLNTEKKQAAVAEETPTNFQVPSDLEDIEKLVS